jgi:carbon storage regulator CsrA
VSNGLLVTELRLRDKPAGLVLARKAGERVRIGGVGMVQVLSIDGGIVRLLFDIDRAIRVDRAEVAERMGLALDGGAT